eukprot:m.104624 g.104624  ORF g.104624 m.104624 type:complete len:125 (+) comp27580_c0_seq1:1529-1903(+)
MCARGSDGKFMIRSLVISASKSNTSLSSAYVAYDGSIRSGRTDASAPMFPSLPMMTVRFFLIDRTTTEFNKQTTPEEKNTSKKKKGNQKTTSPNEEVSPQSHDEVCWTFYEQEKKRVIRSTLMS